MLLNVAESGLLVNPESIGNHCRCLLGETRYEGSTRLSNGAFIFVKASIEIKDRTYLAEALFSWTWWMASSIPTLETCPISTQVSLSDQDTTWNWMATPCMWAQPLVPMGNPSRTAPQSRNLDGGAWASWMIGHLWDNLHTICWRGRNTVFHHKDSEQAQIMEKQDCPVLLPMQPYISSWPWSPIRNPSHRQNQQYNCNRSPLYMHQWPHY